MSVFFIGFALLAVVVIAKTAILVTQQNAYVVEKLGKYSGTLQAGFHLLMPFVDVIRSKWDLREMALDIPEQICITRDNVQVGIDGILYLQVLDAERATYGVANLTFAVTQLAQTMLRSEVGKIELDRTFEERSSINHAVISELERATSPWGVKVLRYEIKNITPPRDVIAAMEKQMRAEREKRAQILASEGERDSAVNHAEGEKQQVIKKSEAYKEQQINEAAGQAAAIIARAEAIQQAGGTEAVQLRVAEQYIEAFSGLAQKSNTMIIPSNVADVTSVLATAMSAAKIAKG